MTKEVEIPKECRRWREGWKVLFIAHKKANVRMSSMPDLPAALAYPKGEIVRRRPGDGPLAVFDNLYDAKAFRGYPNGMFIIVRCLWKPSRARGLWFKAILPPASPTTTIDGFTDDTWEYVYHRTPLEDLPPGTRLADAVFCLE